MSREHPTFTISKDKAIAALGGTLPYHIQFVLTKEELLLKVKLEDKPIHKSNGKLEDEKKLPGKGSFLLEQSNKKLKQEKSLPGEGSFLLSVIETAWSVFDVVVECIVRTVILKVIAAMRNDFGTEQSKKET